MAELLSDTEWDPVSDISTNHLSFLMMMGLPKRFFRKEDQKQRVRDVEHALSASGVGEDVVRNRVVGSFAMGYSIPDAVKLTNPPSIVNFDRTVDVLIEIKKLKVAEDVSESQNRRLFATLDCSEVHFGYARLRVENAELSPTLSGGHESVIFGEESSKYFVSSKYHRENSTLDGAENKLEQEDVDQKYLYNQSVAFPCVTWPKFAMDWITRPRNGKWLSELSAESISSRGCHVIPFSHPNSSSHDTEWKISFAVAEKILSEEVVTEDQRRCFVFFLLLARQQTIRSCLEFHHYLTVFYYACEKLSISLWVENPGCCLLYMIDSLVQCLRQKNLQHYFIPQNNLIDFVNEEELSENLEIFENLRTNVVSTFLTFA
ncbi:hypothetical protein FSP39_025101 [Pinctada imbricata]|uniref:Mab-21-like HhH/H2TH-like domain-containing protein n=1 Tax=Pinctada imbricata TaxID=66713 RepID=A0AA89BL67_PINIB|nr:hypothetical protein FSP39_025101 [Pinctada imbricata]